MCNNDEITQNPDSYIYKKWLHWLVYKIANKKDSKVKDIVSDLNKIDEDDIYVQGLNVDKTTEYYKEFIKVWNTPNKEFYLQTEGFYMAFYEGMKPEEGGFYKSFLNDKYMDLAKYCMDLAKRAEKVYKRFNEYEGFLLKKQKEERYKLQISLGNKQPDDYEGFLLKSAKPKTKEEIKRDEWFKWLLSNNTVAGIKLDTKYDDIIERLFIVIQVSQNAFDEKSDELQGEEYESYLICLIFSIVISFDEEVMKNIIKEFDKLVNNYNPSEYNLTKKYNDIIAERVKGTQGKITTFTETSIINRLKSGVSGGRKTKSKSRQTPKKAREEPKKPLNKPPKKPTKKVALKEPNVYGVIKHKIKI
jgi:hypothetical protein